MGERQAGGNRPGWRERFLARSIPAKGLILIFIPVCIQVLFLIVFALIRHNVIQNRNLSLHSTEVLILSLSALNDFTVSFNRSLVYVLTHPLEYRADAERHLNSAAEGIKRLKVEVAAHPSQLAQIAEIETRFEKCRAKIMAILESVKELPQSGSAERTVKVEDLSALLADTARQSRQLREHLESFIKVERDLSDKRQRRLERAFNGLQWLFFAGVISIIIGAWSLHKLFSEVFSKRVQAVIRHVKSITQPADFRHSLSGTDELAEIDHALELMSQSLKQKEAETELFVYSVSHDLRSPMVNLHGFTEELRLSINDIRNLLTESPSDPEFKDKSLAIIDTQLKEALRYVTAAVARISAIIESLLRISRAGRNDYEMGRVDLNELVRKVIEALSKTITEKKANVQLGSLPVVWGNHVALEQVFQNLLVNALKYSDPDVPPQVEVGMKDGEPMFATVFVKDNGLGIPEASLSKMFVAFRRFHPQVPGGEGIGLAISRQMILRHRGRIWCESRTGTGSGSTFYVSLPLWNEDLGKRR